jgi:hypothetical protein
MQKGKYLVKKLNYFIFPNGSMFKNTLILKQNFLKVKANPLKKIQKIKNQSVNYQD